MTRRWLAVLLGGGLIAGPAEALMLELPLETVVREADTVVRGRVVNRRSFWGPDHYTIYTDVLVAVDEVLKGDASRGAVTVVRVEGGVVGDSRIEVEHQPVLVPGEEVMLFLASTPGSAVRRIPCLEQGKFTIVGNSIAGAGGRSETLDAFADRLAPLLPVR